MKYTHPTQTATILKRYKRFLSDIKLDTGEIINAHVPNTGSMTTCWAENWKVLISQNNDPKRKLKYTLELTHNGKAWICVNTNLTNKLVNEALQNNVITEVQGYTDIKPEKKVRDSRIDFFLSGHESKSDIYIEVKNVTLKGDGKTVLFPDSVTTRGQKHLKDLIELKNEGYRTCMLYIVNREDGEIFKPAKDIDPVYASLLSEAKEAGVEILAYKTKITEHDIVVTEKIKVEL